MDKNEIELTCEQVDDMLHAVGISHSKENLGWRNYFHTDEPEPHLDKLVEIGFMGRHNKIYYVKRAGWKHLDERFGEELQWNKEFLMGLLRA